MGAGEVAELVLQRGGVRPERLQDYMAGPVSDLAAADVAVFDDDDAAVRLMQAQVVHDDLAVAAELAAQAVGDLAEHLQRGFVQQGVTIPFWKLYFLHPITKLLCTQAQYYK